MAGQGARRTRAGRTRLRRPQLRDDEAPHVASGTAVAIEALRTGLSPATPSPRRREDAALESDAILVGDPDDHALENEYVGEDTPGASTPTPDQNGVDAIGRAYGLQEEDCGALRSGAEVLKRRDRHRSELTAPRRPPV